MSAHIAMQFTPTPESAEAVIGQELQLRVALHETADGGITLDLRIEGDAGEGLGFATLVFDFADHELLGGLSLTGRHLSGQKFAAGLVRATGDAGRGFDCGARFGRAHAMGDATPQEAGLHLAHDSLAITLDDLAGRAFALHLVPVAANHAPCDTLVIEGRLPGRPAGSGQAGPSKDGSVFGGLFDEILPLMSRRPSSMGRAA